jgi:hypothetical protein
MAVNALRTKETPEDGHGIGTETCRVFIMTLFKEYFNKFLCFNVNVKECFEISA